MVYAVIVIFSTTIGALLGILLVGDNLREKADACAKTHNVYRCELVAVPVTSKEQ